MEALLVSHLVAVTKPIRSYVIAFSKSVNVFLRTVREFGMDMYTPAIFKMDNQQVQHRELCSTFMWQPGWPGSLGESRDMNMCD